MKVIVFYGTDCNDKTAWIPWLKEQLTKQGVECVIPNLPTPENQTYKSWAKITKNININDDDIIVGWSTGAIFSVRYLYENNIKVKKLILISGFNNDDPFISQQALNDFANELNAKTINILSGGHFNSNAGYNKFPELLSQIKK